MSRSGRCMGSGSGGAGRVVSGQGCRSSTATTTSSSICEKRVVLPLYVRDEFFGELFGVLHLLLSLSSDE